ncbi:hypothetical protein LDL36_20295 [Komagataeibacter sp. FNDCR1]|nr:hypothetical protein [Komagataeibacter sp. FNDCR1]
MGEAKRRREWQESRTAEGLPVPRPTECPSCGVRETTTVQTNARLRELGLPREVGFCGSCRAIWEVFPPQYIADPVCAEPCDNCAFRPGAPEQDDPETWKALLDSLQVDGDGMFTGRFYCHKHVPIDMSKGPGNFLFPRRADGSWDTAKMRVCSGFLRMFWARKRKLGLM